MVALPNDVDKHLDDFCFQVYIEVELLQSGVAEDDEASQTKLFTGVKYGYELNEMLQFPLKIKDLGPLARLSFTIYDMDRENEEPLCSTVVDLFDAHKRLR